ncbi:MAG TPA: hypothetical protein VIG08_13350 [Gemmatimonadales bacterium]|jgi:hypothetical protein
MRWHALAFPALIAAALVGCNKSGTNGETGAVPGGTPADTSAVSAPAPAATDTTAMPAPGADTTTHSDTSMYKDSTAK